MRISVVMPAYNEEETIEKTVRLCFEVLSEFPGNHEVVVTNDGSKDGTGEVLERLCQEYPMLIVAQNNPNQGYGAALTKAMECSSGDVVASIDSDGQFDIRELGRLLNGFDGATDILTGYREAKQDSFVKVYGDRVMNFIIRLMFGVGFRDTNCAFKLYRGDVIRTMNLEARGFQIPTEIILKADVLKMRIKELPVSHRQRDGGQSALAPFKTAVSMLVFLLYLRFKISLYRRNIIRSL